MYIVLYIFFFFNDTATTEIYTLSLHDALPIFGDEDGLAQRVAVPVGAGAGHEVHEVGADPRRRRRGGDGVDVDVAGEPRSEEHTSELQSRQYLVCRLLLEKKKIYMFLNCDIPL